MLGTKCDCQSDKAVSSDGYFARWCDSIAERLSLSLLVCHFTGDRMQPCWVTVVHICLWFFNTKLKNTNEWFSFADEGKDLLNVTKMLYYESFLLIIKNKFFDLCNKLYCLSQCRCSLRVTVWLKWSRAAAFQPMISGKCSRGTSRSACAASQRLTAWARRRCSAPGWPSLTPSTAATKIRARHSSAWLPARPPSWSWARTSCTRCSRTSSASKSLSTSCFIKPAR